MRLSTSPPSRCIASLSHTFYRYLLPLLQMPEWDTYAYRWWNMDTTVEVQKRIIALGAGIWVHRYAVVQDGRVKDLFIEREDADRFMETITRNWEAKD